MNLRRSPALNVFLLGMSAAVALGIARFGYALVLPDMQRDLDWSYAQAGWLGTSNAAGYLAGALLAATAVARFGVRTMLTFSCWTTALAVLATSFTSHYAMLNALRFVAGVSGALAFICGGMLAASVVSTLAHTRDRGKVLGLFYATPGLGIVLSAIVVPLTIANGDWRLAWLLLGAIACVLAVLMAFAHVDAGKVAAGQADGQPYARSRIVPLLIAYACFGAGYIGYMTFMFAHLRGLGVSGGQLTLFWCVIGLGIMVSPWLWARVLDKQPHGKAFSFPCLVLMVGAGLPLINDSWAMALVSAFVFGSAVLTVPASTTAFVRRNFSGGDWARAMGTLTVAFSLGQIAGPVLTGYISDLSGRLNDGLWWGWGFLLVGSLLALAQRDMSARVSETGRSSDNS